MRSFCRVNVVFSALMMLVVGLSMGGCHTQEAEDSVASKYKRGFRPIINGTLDTSQEHMGVVALYNTQGAMCTGTLVSPRVVLTAAHCVQGTYPSQLNVIFGTDIQTGTWIGVADTLVHPDYYAGGSYDAPIYDIAMVRMNQDAPTNVSVIPYLPEAYSLTNSDVGSPLTFVGFGTTGGGQNTQKYYFDGSLSVVCDGPNECIYGGAEVSPYAIAYSNQYGGPCSGDSGGPALVEMGGIEYVAGVTSYGDQNCEYYGVSTKVDRFQQFIEDFVGNTVVEDCVNGVDDDGDGVTDCADPECASEGYCSGPEACEEAVTLGCDEVATGTTVGAAMRYIQYSCAGDQEVGPEVGYQLSVPLGTQVNVTLTPTGGADLDLFALPVLADSCDPNGCFGVSNNSGSTPETLTFTVTEGTYLVVDSFGETGGTYSLELSCDEDAEICDNGVDDDQDGHTDCQDPDCEAAVNCEAVDEICDNDIDDDNDGATDCDDTECASFGGCGTGVPEMCDNNRDDDGDGYVDCADSDCESLPGCQSAVEICGDGVDNDDDGLIGCIDPDCRNHEMCAQIPPEICNNGVDDDGDTFPDCGDPDCATDPACSGRPPEVCYGGDDEDGDGLVDCGDPDCFTYEPCKGNGGGGGGGCSCRATPNGGSGAPAGGVLALLALVGLVTRRRRQRNG